MCYNITRIIEFCVINLFFQPITQTDLPQHDKQHRGCGIEDYVLTCHGGGQMFGRSVKRIQLNELSPMLRQHFTTTHPRLTAAHLQSTTSSSIYDNPIVLAKVQLI